MAIEKVKEYFKRLGIDGRGLEFDVSSATVELAAEALGTELAAIAKTLSFLVDEKPVLILTEGTARVDNHKFKETFHTKAHMIPREQVEELVGHAPGGVCPFGIRDGVRVYFDESLKKHAVVYPAAGDDHSGVKLTISELEEAVPGARWVDVCKD